MRENLHRFLRAARGAGVRVSPAESIDAMRAVATVGFADRGILREGFAADIIVYEQEKLGFLYDSPVYAADFPGGERRLIQKAKGIRYTIVNGGITFEESECTQATPGKFLRSYDMVVR